MSIFGAISGDVAAEEKENVERVVNRSREQLKSGRLTHTAAEKGILPSVFCVIRSMLIIGTVKVLKTDTYCCTSERTEKGFLLC